jgi:uncharacterized protein
MTRLLALAVLVVRVAATEGNPFNAPAAPAIYKDVTASSRYIAISDGVRLAVDVILPRDLPASQKIAAIFKITRYGRANASGDISAADRFWVTHGFARVLVDERGTGASFGHVHYGKATLGDLRQMVDWVVAQPWSNGRVGAIGNSYEGTTAELLAACGHPAVRAVMPLFSDFNYYTDLIRPGGVFNDWLIHTWGLETRRMDAGEGAKRVETDTDGSLLKQAIAEHAANPDLYAAVLKAEYFGDAVDAFGGTYRDMSNVGLREQLTKGGVPMLIFAGWMDAGTAQGAIERFHTIPTHQRVFVGSWSHGAGYNADPFAASQMAEPSAQQRLFEALRFFDHHPRGSPDPLSDERRFYYTTLGESEWKSTVTWPPPGFSSAAYYLSAGGQLRPKQEGAAIPVNLGSASTGERNRWHSQLTGNNVIYTEVLPKMQTLAPFTSPPLDRDVEITGQPVLHLRMRAMHEDPALLAYLVAVDLQDRAVYLTEGHLRMVHRKLATSEPTLHTYLRLDGLSAGSGEEMDAAVTLLPLSALIPRGFKLRILLAAADDADFPGTAYSAVIESSSCLDLPLKNHTNVSTADSTPTAAMPGKPNFTGTWRLNLAESDFSDPHAAKPDSLVRTVQQEGDSLSYKVQRQVQGRKAEFQVDLIIGGRAFESNQVGIVTARWEGETLSIRTVTNPGGDRQTEQMEKWTLSPDGTRVIDSFSARLPDGTEIKIRRVFVR